MNAGKRFFTVSLAAVTLGASARCFLSKQGAYNAVVCDRSSCSHTTAAVKTFRFGGEGL